MKKLLMSVFLVMGMMLPYAAMADGTQHCIYFNTDYTNKGPVAVVYFDNDDDAVPKDCEFAVDGLVSDLESRADSMRAILVVGSTDSTASNTYNDDLSKRRAEHVYNRLKQSTKLADKLCADTDSTCLLKLNVGENLIQNLGEADNTPNEWARAVFIYVMFKQHTCSEDLRGLLDTVLAAEFKAGNECETVKSNVTNAASKCVKGKYLSQVDDDAIMNALTQTVPCLTEPDVIENVTKTVKITFNLTAVSDAYNRLQQMRRDFDVTVWKTEDGKFNTSRLISDSVAGVVLGTTGALVTSKLVKKSQIKNGFEDIQCTIGGQNVANWGDEFVVGMQ